MQIVALFAAGFSSAQDTNPELWEGTGRNTRNVYLCPTCSFEQFWAVPLPGPNWSRNVSDGDNRLFLPDSATNSPPTAEALPPETDLSLDLVPEIEGADHFLVARVLSVSVLDFGALTLSDDWLTISLDTSGTVGGVAFDDEDILVHHPTIGSWYMGYDASAWAPEMEGGPATNAIFVPEPSMPLLLVAGTALLLSVRRERLRSRPAVFALALAGITFTASAVPDTARAVDGVIEINQVSVATFPYVISQPGSYVLTSDLSVSNFGTSAIRIDVHDVTVDLNGFSIQYTFTGGPAAAGIDASASARSTIRNGRVRGFVGDCISAGYLAVIEDVVVTGCGENGLELGSSATVRNVGAHSNGNHGVSTGVSSRISDSLTSYNTADGIHGGGKMSGNVSNNNGGHGLLAISLTHVTDNTSHTNGGRDLEVDSCPLIAPLPYVIHARNLLPDLSTSACLAPE